jgi:ribonuclease HIII
MAVEQIAKSDEQQIDATNLNNGIDVKNLTDKEIADLANEIVSNPNNVEQVKVFPDLWNSLNDQQKSDFVSKLE